MHHIHVNNMCTYSFCSSADCTQGLFRDMALISEYFALYTLAQKAGGGLQGPQPYCLHEPHFFRSYFNNCPPFTSGQTDNSRSKEDNSGTHLFTCKDKNGSWSCFFSFIDSADGYKTGERKKDYSPMVLILDLPRTTKILAIFEIYTGRRSN